MTPILGKAVATAEQMAAYLLSKNPNPKIDMEPVAFCRLFLYLGALEGVRGDAEFAQSCWETNYFRYGGIVTPDQNNYAGLGTTSATNKGEYFPDEATGILAQAQHDKSYATKKDLNYDCVDPRRTKWFVDVKGGTAKCWEDLGGTWAVPGYDTNKYKSLEEANKAKDSYGYKIINILNEILAMPVDGKVDEPAKEEDKTEIPKEEPAEENTKPLAGIRICDDAGHYGKYNRCPAIPAYYESDMAWKLHLMLKQYLEELGAEVILTRPNQSVDKALKERGMTAKDCHLFISIHSNAVGGGMNESIDYVAVYHLTDDAGAVCDDISKEIAEKLAPVIADVMGVKQGYKILTRKSGNDLNKDGVLNDNYYGVLNGARAVDVPGLILEHSFHTNSKSVYWLLNWENLDKLARAEAQAIAEYFSGRDIQFEESTVDVPYCIRIANVDVGDVLNIRKEPNADSEKTGELTYNDPHKYTIVEERNGWGKLKSGIGWIKLKYTQRA